MLGLQTYFTKKKKKNYKLIDVAQHNWVSQNLNFSHIRSCCATSVCKFFFIKCICKPSILLWIILINIANPSLRKIMPKKVAIEYKLMVKIELMNYTIYFKQTNL
jgi:hypothetical protein